MALKLLFITMETGTVRNFQNKHLSDCHVDIAENGQRAKQLLRDVPCTYAAIVLDEKLLNTNAVEVLGWIHLQHATTPVIGLSYTVRAWSGINGPFTHIPKLRNHDQASPWPEDNLLATIKACTVAIAAA